LAAVGRGQNVSGTYYLAGGGGGAPAFQCNVPGGFGGGGLGQSSFDGCGGGGAGTVNTGGGGGGAGVYAGTGPGGSGIVLVRYPSTFTLATSTTGSPSVLTSGGFNYYTFNGSGSITF
jgi:hypothetical protein